jgi:hypothetical protein
MMLRVENDFTAAIILNIDEHHHTSVDIKLNCISEPKAKEIAVKVN